MIICPRLPETVTFTMMLFLSLPSLLSYTTWKVCWLYNLLKSTRFLPYYLIRNIEDMEKSNSHIIYLFDCLVLYVCVCVLCAYVNTLVWGCVCYMCMWRGKYVNIRCLPLLITTLFLTQSVSLNPELMFWLGWLAGLPVGSTCFLLASTEVPDVDHCFWLFHGCWESKLRPSCLDSDSTHWAPILHFLALTNLHHQHLQTPAGRNPSFLLMKTQWHSQWQH